MTARAARAVMVAALCLSAATPFAQRGKQQGRPADTQRPQQGALKVGDLAPDFTLAPRDGGAPVSLASFRGRSPVALVFGSFT